MMFLRSTRRVLVSSLVVWFWFVAAVVSGRPCLAQRPNEIQFDDVRLRASVIKAMKEGCDYLELRQDPDGSWPGGTKLTNNKVGVTSLAVLALINCDRPVDSASVQNGLQFLRNIPPGGVDSQHAVYEMSLALMALCAAEEYDKDLRRIQKMALLIENAQLKKGTGRGLWEYQLKDPNHDSGDASNGQYAVLALRDAVYAGAEVSRETWERVHQRWVNDQLPNGGWGYNSGNRTSSGSMTAAGLSTIAITSRMLQDDSDVDNLGRPDCCETSAPDKVMENGRRWLAENFSVNNNPGGNQFHFYYLYGLERAGRMSGVRFFGRHDWYRQGAETFVKLQKAGGNWISSGLEQDEVANTSMALLFLSKGLSRVVVNKLDYNSPNGVSQDNGEWNRHRFDVVNLVEYIDGLPRWPARLTSQVVTLSRLKPETAVEEMNQAPVLFISGRDAPQLTVEQVSWLRNYVDAGGFIFASSNCDGRGFDQGFREIVTRMFPQGDASLQRLTADHPVFRSEYLLNAENMELWGVDFGCRTSIIYSPDDLGCLWQKWMKHEPRNRKQELSQRIIRGTRIGVNVIAYATGREPPEKLNDASGRRKAGAAIIQRGLVEIGKLRHNGGWDTAPKALKNLLTALNETVGVAAATQAEAIPPSLEDLSRFPLVYMHGRYRFQIPAQQQQVLRDYLDRGGVLFADSCCGSSNFDRSFRELIKQLYPDQTLKQIPADHEMFTEAIGHEIKQTTRRRLVPDQENAALTMKTETGPPLLEGIEVDGRYSVIYSKYDISCALEHQASLSCDGYIEEDAAKIAVNVVLYSMLQNINWSEDVDPAAEPVPGNN